MKSILINSALKTVTEVDYSGNYKDIYKLLGCKMFEVIHLDDNGEDCFVDEEGLLTLTAETTFFFYKGTHQPIAGNGLILRCNDEGESVATKLTVEAVKANVQFMNLEEVREL
jgi:hypothetical protein